FIAPPFLPAPYLFRLFKLPLDDLEGLQDTQTGHNRIGCSDGWDDIARHLLDVKARLPVYAENCRADVGARGDEIERILVVFVKLNDRRRVCFCHSLSHLADSLT